MDDWQKYLPKAPQTQDDMDERSAKNRLFIAKNIAEYGGVSIKDQCDFFNKISWQNILSIVVVVLPVPDLPSTNMLSVELRILS